MQWYAKVYSDGLGISLSLQSTCLDLVRSLALNKLFVMVHVCNHRKVKAILGCIPRVEAILRHTRPCLQTKYVLMIFSALAGYFLRKAVIQANTDGLDTRGIISPKTQGNECQMKWYNADGLDSGRILSPKRQGNVYQMMWRNVKTASTALW